MNLFEKKVLLIDDSVTIRRTGELLLKQSGFTVLIAEDGLSGLEKAKTESPSIIFIDVMMPHIDGYQVCAAIKNNPSLKHIPIVMLTSKDTMLDKARGELVGANMYLIKPFNKASLLDAINALN